MRIGLSCKDGNKGRVESCGGLKIMHGGEMVGLCGRILSPARILFLTENMIFIDA
jgi:hypothetical protein